MNNYTTSHTLPQGLLSLLSGAAEYQAAGMPFVGAAQALNSTPIQQAANQNYTYNSFTENQFFTKTEKPVFVAFTNSMDLGKPPQKSKAISARLALVSTFGSHVVAFEKMPKSTRGFSYTMGK